jgi:chromosome segregation ATPase
MDYFSKYQKYKAKYTALKDSCGGARGASDELRVFFLTENVYKECMSDDKTLQQKKTKLEQKLKQKQEELKKIEEDIFGENDLNKIELTLTSETSETQVGGILSLFKKSASEKIEAHKKKTEAKHQKIEQKKALIQAKAEAKIQKQHAKTEQASQKYKALKQKVIQEEKQKIVQLEQKIKELDSRLTSGIRKCNFTVYGTKLYNIITSSLKSAKHSITFQLENLAPYAVHNDTVLSFIDANNKPNNKNKLRQKFNYTNKTELSNMMKLINSQSKRQDDFKHIVIVKKYSTSPDILVSFYDVSGENITLKNPLK